MNTSTEITTSGITRGTDEDPRRVDERLVFGDAGIHHQTAEDDPALARHEVGPAQRAIVDRHPARDQAHASALTEQQGDGRHEGQHGVVARAHRRDNCRGEEHRKRQQLRHGTALIDQVFGQLLQRAVDGGEAVKQAHRKDDEENLQRPHADDCGRAETHAETTDQVGEGDGEQADVDPGFVAKGDGDDDRRDDEHAHHVRVSWC